MNLYHLLSRRNDLRSILKGRYPQRFVRKQVWRQTSRLARLVCRVMGVGR